MAEKNKNKNQNKNKPKKSQTKKAPLFNIARVFVVEGFLFFLTLMLGIFTADKLIEMSESQNFSLPTFSVLDFLISFLLITVIVLLLAFFKRFKKGKSVIYKALFAIAFFWSGGMALSLWLGVFGLLLMAGLVFFWLTSPQVYLHNIIVVLGIMGAGSFLGLGFSPEIIVGLLILFSIYDFIAVYKTKHMVKMAKDMLKTGSILGLIIPLKISELKSRLEKVKPGGSFLVLGGGDVVFPLLLVASVVQDGFLNSFIISIFALIGLFASLWLFASQKTKSPVPALPPIAFFSIIGYLLTMLI